MLLLYTCFIKTCNFVFAVYWLPVTICQMLHVPVSLQCLTFLCWHLACTYLPYHDVPIFNYLYSKFYRQPSSVYRYLFICVMSKVSNMTVKHSSMQNTVKWVMFAITFNCLLARFYFQFPAESLRLCRNVREIFAMSIVLWIWAKVNFSWTLTNMCTNWKNLCDLERAWKLNYPGGRDS